MPGSELALEIRKEIEARYDEADQARRRAGVERAQIDAELAQRRFMLVDPGNPHVAEYAGRAKSNNKLRILAGTGRQSARPAPGHRIA